MASGDDNPLGGTIDPRTASGAAITGDNTAAAGSGPRRRRSKEPQEAIDELAQETKRVTLLEREEQQLKGRKHVSRLLFAFGIVDDRKTQQTVEQEFLTWQSAEEGGDEVTGVLIFLGPAAVSFLEGPTEVLFKALEFFHGLTLDVVAPAAAPLPPPDVRTAPSSDTTAAAPAPRGALISPVRVLYFTELHGVRTSVGWCSIVSSAKPGQSGSLEDGASEAVFQIYQKLLTSCLKVQQAAGSGRSPALEALQGHYRKVQDSMPTPDEATLILSKQGGETLFSFSEFQAVFMKPFQLALNSELLWPMPPPLSY